MTCEICDGSGMLNVESSYAPHAWVFEAAACHACDAGLMWTELLSL